MEKVHDRLEGEQSWIMASSTEVSCLGWFAGAPEMTLKASRTQEESKQGGMVHQKTSIKA